MKLNKTKRKITGALFVLLFIILGPSIIFYATGGQFGESFKILQTGGLFVRSVPLGSTVYINSKLKKETGFFDRNILVKSLHPGEYLVSIEKDGYNSWAKKIMVYANMVTDTRAFMLPKVIETIEIKKYLETDISNSTSTAVLKKNNPDYEDAVALFSSTTTIKTATTTGLMGTIKNPITKRNFELWREGGEVFLTWVGRKDSTPVIFCDNEVCVEKIKVFSFNQRISELDFFPDESEIALAAVGDKIFAFELDSNPDKRPQIIYSGVNPDFKMDDQGSIFVKDGAFYGKIDI